MTYNPRYAKRYALDRHRGIDRSPIPTETVRAHITHLRDCGLSLGAIADTAGVSRGLPSAILRRTNPTTHRDSARRILAVTPARAYNRPNAAGFVPKIGAVRRIQALQAIGWSGALINEHAERSQRLAQNVVHQAGEWIALDTWRAIADTYDALSMTPGPSEQARGSARKHGYAPPLAWEEGALDDPAATPHTDEVARRRVTKGAGVVNADSLTDCAEWGMTVQQAADRLGVQRDYIVSALRGLDNGDRLQRAFERNAIAQGHDRATRDGLGIRKTA